MTNFNVAPLADWPEKALKNFNNPNSAETGRERYHDPYNVAGSWPLELGVSRTPFIPPAGGRRLCQKAHDFVDDFYNRIHMTPQRIDAGLITSDVSYPVWLFNAYLTTSVTFSAVEAGVAQGLDIDLIIPCTLGRLLDIEVTVTFLESGPPVQDTDILFKNNVKDLVLPVTGRRLVDFEPEPSWGDGFELTMTYNTVITRLGRQREQRRPLSNYPMWQLSFNVWDARQKGREVSALFKTGLNRIVTLPVFIAGVAVLEILGVRSIRVADISRNWWFVRNAQVVTVRDNFGNRQTLNLAGIDVATGILTFAEDLRLAAATEAFPCVQAYYTGATARAITNDLTVWAVTFNIYAYGAEPLRGLPEPPEIFPFGFNWDTNPRLQPEITRAVTYVPGGIEIITPLITYPYDSVEGKVALFSQADEFKFMDFYAGVKGRHRSFKLYNPPALFEVAVPVRAGSSMIRVKGNKNNPFSIRHPLTLYAQTGAAAKPEITADTIHPRDDGDSDLYLTAPCPVNLPIGRLLGQVYTVRFDTDTVTIKYAAPNKADVNLKFKEVLDADV